MRPAGRRPGMLWIAAGLAAFLVLGLASAFGLAKLSGLDDCTDEERAVFEEFPQYGGQEIEPEPESVTGGCVARFNTSDPEEEVFAYYSERLRENGWEVEREPPPYSELTEPTVAGETDPARVVGSTLFATRGVYAYRLTYLPQPQSDEARI